MTSEDERGRPRFRTREKSVAAPKDAESLFGELPRTPRGVGALWSHQADHLRTYDRDHRTTEDVALELPTGSGKTLVGLLIADWRRRALRHRVVYACPTKQLARQVLRSAENQGIPVVLLIGPNSQWDLRQVTHYSAADAVAVTVYSHIFNINSHLSDAQTLVFDDAHAAEGFVAEAWALTIDRDHLAYKDLFDALGANIDPHLVARMTGPVSSTSSGMEVRMIPVSSISHCIEDIDRLLAAELTGAAAWEFKMIRPSLKSCLFYVARSGWYVRPMIPPTFDHPPFTDPEQRIYLSATLGEAGELERAFGRFPIARVPVPPAWDRTGSGRRFFAFPDLATTSGDATRRILGLADKRLVLTPDDASANNIAQFLRVPPDERFTVKDAETGLQPFLDATRGTLLAANRYDGMDLADNACRMVLLERIRTRVTQGAGRCTRGPKDYAVVVIQGEELVRFLSREDVRAAMPVELQAEVGFGLHVCEVPTDDLVMLAESALKQDQVWQQDAEPDLAERRREATKISPPNTNQLATSAAREVRAWQAAWRQNWEVAAGAAVDVLEHLTASSLRPYRALWAYLASAWWTLAAEDGNPVAGERAAHWLQQAHRAAEGTTWLREVQQQPGGTAAMEPIDEAGANGVIEAVTGSMKSAAAFEACSGAMLTGLSQTNAPDYEQALVTLGTLLGAESYKPAGKGQTDAAWVWPDMWMSVVK